MKWGAEVKRPKHIRCVIEKEQFRDVMTGENLDGFCLYIYENENQRCTWDYQYFDFEKAKHHAFNKFEIPLDSWVEIE